MTNPSSTNDDSTLVPSLTQYSINLDENGPLVPFFEAHTLALASDGAESEILLSDRDFTIWQRPTTPQECSLGLLLTPP